MRILHVSALPIWSLKGTGGMPSLARTLRGHVRAGHEVAIVVPQYHLFTDDATPLEFRRDQGYEIHVAPCSWLPAVKMLRVCARRLGKGRELPYALRWLINMSACLLLTVSLVLAAMRVTYRHRRRFGLVYAHCEYAALAGYLLGLILKVPNVTRLYGTFLAELMRKPLVWLRYPVAAAGFLVPHDLLICANDGTRGDEVAERLGIDLDRFRFWQNGVDLPAEPPDNTRDRLVERFPNLGLRPDSKWVLSCSRLSHWKRIDRIIRAVGVCRQRGCNCQLLVAGDGAERDSLRALAEELGVGGDVVWLEAVAHDDVWRLMNLADVFMVTNDVSNRGNPLCEAIRTGLPIVSIKDPSTADLLEDGVNALLADRNNVEELGECLERICNDPELAESMRRAQAERSAMFWTWEERMTTEIKDLETLVGNC